MRSLPSGPWEVLFQRALRLVDDIQRHGGLANPFWTFGGGTVLMFRYGHRLSKDIDEYLKHPPSRDELVQLLAAMRMPVRELLRRKGTPHDELGLDASHWTDDHLLDFIVQHPILMNRPIVVTPLGTRLCRPSEAVLDLLPGPLPGPFNKEDGEPVLDAEGRRVVR
jgi:arsenate reductase